MANYNRMQAAMRRDERRAKRLRVFVGVLAILLVIVLGAVAALAIMQPSSPSSSPSQAESTTAFDDASMGESAQAEGASSARADIVMTPGGSHETYVLAGEEYLEPGCHAYDKASGKNVGKVTASGQVDTSAPGDYTITYTATAANGAQAQTERTVHVVENFDDFAGAAETIPVLMYHYVYTKDDAPDTMDANYLLDTKFAKQLKYLVKHHYYYPSYQEIRAFAQGAHTLPARSVVLTFDDGQKGFLKYGIPLLEKYQVPATSFVICADKKATRKKLKTYASEYVSFQSHSFNMHRDGSDVGRGGIIHAMSTQEIVADLKKAQKILGTTEAFAYPYGDNNENAWKAMDQAGVLCAFTIENRRIKPGDQVEALPRVRIAGEYTQEGFEYLVEPNGGEQ